MNDIMLAVLALIIIIQEIMHYKERRDLYNRLMSRDVKDYQSITQNKPPTKESRQAMLRKKWTEKGVK